MAGFFGLFGGKKQDEAAAQEQATNGEAYYLNMDEARTYGDLNYMRTVKKVRRTFPKTVNNAEIEMEKEVSAMTMNNGDLGSQVPKVSMGSIVTSTPAETSNGNGAAPVNSEVNARRKSDPSLDMFRNMAKDIRK